MKKFCIIGGHILNKSLSLIEKESAIKLLYLPKSSLAAIGNNSLKEHSEITSRLKPELTREAIETDLSGDMIKKIQEKNPDIIYLDFTCEIYDYIELCDSKAILKSDYLSKNISLEIFSNAITLKRNSAEAWAHWKNGCDLLVEKFQSKLYICKIYYPTTYILNGIKTLYSKEKTLNIQKFNSILNECYDYIEKTHKVNVINVDVNLFESKTPESEGFNYFNFPEENIHEIALKISSESGKLKLKAKPEEAINKAMKLMHEIISDGEIPSIYDLYQTGLKFLAQSDLKSAIKCERLIMLLRNSSVPLSAKLGIVTFGYGGIGVIIHRDCIIGDYVVIGANVTLGGGKTNILTNKKIPTVEDRVYVGAGAKIIGGITIGHHSIIGVNAVVNRDIPPFSVVAGNPAKVISKISSVNFKEYKSYLYKTIPDNDAFEIMTSRGMESIK